VGKRRDRRGSWKDSSIKQENAEPLSNRRGSWRDSILISALFFKAHNSENFVNILI
jgi:hypothetical protein